MKFVSIILFIVCMVPATLWSKNKIITKVSIEDHYESCKVHISKNKMVSARRCCKQINESYPDSKMGILCLSDILTYQRDYHGALEILKNTEGENHDHDNKRDNCYLNEKQGLIYDKLLDYETAIAKWKQAAKDCSGFQEHASVIKNNIDAINKKIKIRPNIRYGQQYVKGSLYLVGQEGGKEVLAMLTKGSDTVASLIFTNSTDKIIDIHPDEIQLVAIGPRPAKPPKHSQKRVISSYDKTKQQSLKVYTEDEYRRKLKSNQTAGALLFGLFSGITSGLASVTTANTYGYTSSGQVISATTTTYNPALAASLTQMQTSAFTNQLNAEYNVLTSNLLGRHELPPKSVYGGLVHIKGVAADSYKLIIPFGGQDFEFIFTSD